MSNLLFTINAVVPLFVLVGAGYWIKQKNFLNSAFVEIFNSFAFKVAIPLSLFKTAYGSNIRTNFNPKLVFANMLAIFLIAGLMWIIVPRFTSRPRAGTIIQGIYRTNIVLFGLSLCTNLFGAENTAPMAVLIAVSVPTYNMLAVIILTIMGENGSKIPSAFTLFKSVLKNPLIIATLLGLACSYFDVVLPPLIMVPVKDLAACATPLAMLSLGGQFSFTSAKKNLKANLFTSCMRLVVVPGILIPIFIFMGFRGNELGALFINFAAPTATSSFIMAKNLGCDGDLAGEVVVFSTLFAAFTVFAWVFVLKSINLI